MEEAKQDVTSTPNTADPQKEKKGSPVKAIFGSIVGIFLVAGLSVFCIAAAVLGYMQYTTNQNLESTRAELSATHLTLEETEKKLSDTRNWWDETKATLADTAKQLNDAQTDIESLSGELSAAESSLADAESALDVWEKFTVCKQPIDIPDYSDVNGVTELLSDYFIDVWKLQINKTEKQEWAFLLTGGIPEVYNVYLLSYPEKLFGVRAVTATIAVATFDRADGMEGALWFDHGCWIDPPDGN